MQKLNRRGLAKVFAILVCVSVTFMIITMLTSMVLMDHTSYFSGSAAQFYMNTMITVYFGVAVISMTVGSYLATRAPKPPTRKKSYGRFGIRD